MSERNEREFYYPDPTVRIRVRPMACIIAIAIGLFMIFGPKLAHAADITVTLTQGDTSVCVDGSPAATNCPLTSIEIQTKDATGAWVRKETWTPTQTVAKYTGVALGKTYCFRVRNQSNTVYSAFTPDGCVDVPFVSPRAPLGVDAKVVVNVTMSTTLKAN